MWWLVLIGIAVAAFIAGWACRSRLQPLPSKAEREQLDNLRREALRAEAKTRSLQRRQG